MIVSRHNWLQLMRGWMRPGTWRGYDWRRPGQTGPSGASVQLHVKSAVNIVIVTVMAIKNVAAVGIVSKSSFYYVCLNLTYNSLTISKESSAKSAAASCTCATRTGPSGATTRHARNHAGPASRRGSVPVCIMSMGRINAMSWIVRRVSCATRTIAVSPT